MAALRRRHRHARDSGTCGRRGLSLRRRRQGHLHEPAVRVRHADRSAILAGAAESRRSRRRRDPPTNGRGGTRGARTRPRANTKGRRTRGRDRTSGYRPRQTHADVHEARAAREACRRRCRDLGSEGPVAQAHVGATGRRGLRRRLQKTLTTAPRSRPVVAGLPYARSSVPWSATRPADAGCSTASNARHSRPTSALLSSVASLSIRRHVRAAGWP